GSLGSVFGMDAGVLDGALAEALALVVAAGVADGQGHAAEARRVVVPRGGGAARPARQLLGFGGGPGPAGDPARGGAGHLRVLAHRQVGELGVEVAAAIDVAASGLDQERPDARVAREDLVDLRVGGDRLRSWLHVSGSSSSRSQIAVGC